jgi:hypothetical protein
MSPLAEAIERAAKALGVHESLELMPGDSPWAMGRRGDGYDVQPDGGEPVRIDAPTAAAWLLALHVGGEVDVGPCPACEERGGAWEWGTDGERHGVAWVYGGYAAAEAARRASSWSLVNYHSYADGWWRLVLARPCPDCTRDGKPTGRRFVPLAQAVLDAPGDPAARVALVRRVDEQSEKASLALALWAMSAAIEVAVPALAEALDGVWQALTVECPADDCSMGLMPYEGQGGAMRVPDLPRLRGLRPRAPGGRVSAMNADHRALAQHLATRDHFEWIPGMLARDAAGREIRLTEETLWVVEGRDAWPVITDLATIGCLAGLARRAWPTAEITINTLPDRWLTCVTIKRVEGRDVFWASGPGGALAKVIGAAPAKGDG